MFSKDEKSTEIHKMYKMPQKKELVPLENSRVREEMFEAQLRLEITLFINSDSEYAVELCKDDEDEIFFQAIQAKRLNPLFSPIECILAGILNS